MPELDLHKIEESAAYLKRHGLAEIKRLIILGTGFSHFVSQLEYLEKISYRAIPHFPLATMEEPGYLYFGEWESQRLVVMQGRYHHYEGYPAQEIVLPLRAMKLLGLKQLIISNTAYSLKPELANHSLALIKDHINLIPDNPLRGYNFDNLGPRFPELDGLYSSKLRREVQAIQSELRDKSLAELVYLAYPGPNHPSPAERNFYRIAGADIYGMSTSLETIAAAHMGIEVLGISHICSGKSNQPKGLADQKLSRLLFFLLKNPLS